MKQNHTIRALVSVIALVSVSACVPSAAQYSGAANEKRNEVRMVRLTHAVEVAGGSKLGVNAAAGLDLFLAENSIGYGDSLSLDAGDEPAGDNDRAAIANHLRGRGLLLGNQQTIAGVMPAAGTIVLVVDRYVVTTPNCNDWSNKSKPNYANAESAAFGCSTRAILGQMVANPRDLVRGQEDDGPNAAAATNAVGSYVDGAGTGSGGGSN
jgi:pilus assembly protein CpaD